MQLLLSPDARERDTAAKIISIIVHLHKALQKPIIDMVARGMQEIKMEPTCLFRARTAAPLTVIFYRLLINFECSLTY